MEGFARLMDQETIIAKRDYADGVIPPDFVIDKALIQMRAFADTPTAEAPLIKSIVRRTGEKKIEGDWAGEATKVYLNSVLPALKRQIALLESVRPKATHDAGVWRLKDGGDYYATSLKNYTTATLTPDEIHQLGLDMVAQIEAKADKLFKSIGMSKGTVGERMAELGKDIYENTDAAKEQLIADLNVKAKWIEKQLPAYFGQLPKAPLEIRRVPKAIEAGAPGGYYNGPALDGSRPGQYYINLRDTAEWPKWTLPTLSYHEATPGHHHQIALQQENDDTPMLMKVMGFSAYSEGWALYAEQLADEMGVYEGDPWGQIGYLQSLMFRATRLVVDSGLHHKRWSREQAIRFMVDATGDQESSITTEIERYCVWPGQAASYKVGHTSIVALREDAKRRLGPKFDIRSFHDTLLGVGGVPLEVLKQVMNDWVVRQA